MSKNIGDRHYYLSDDNIDTLLDLIAEGHRTLMTGLTAKINSNKHTLEILDKRYRGAIEEREKYLELLKIILPPGENIFMRHDEAVTKLKKLLENCKTGG